MKITLLGMSNVGKSYWAIKLESVGFTRFCCDDLIEQKLGPILQRLGYSGIHDVAKWIGQPFDENYKDASSQYLLREKEVMGEILSYLKRAQDDEDIVIDTTGSVIYIGNDIMEKLALETKIVYLATPDSVRDEMYKLYIKHPKPVIWGESFCKRNGELDMVALKRCYPELLQFRTGQYKKHADITLDYYLLRSPNFSVEKFMKAINQ